MADETPPRRTTRSQTNGRPSETANGRPVRDRRPRAIPNIGHPAPLLPMPSRAAVAAGAAAPLPDTSPRRRGPPPGQPQTRPEDMPKALAHLLIDPEVRQMGFKTAIGHAAGRHAAAGGAPEEYHALQARRNRYLKAPRVVEIAKEIARADVLERLAREGGGLDALTAAQRHSLAVIRRADPSFGAEAEAEAEAGAVGVGVGVGGGGGGGGGGAAGHDAGAIVGAGGQPVAVAGATATVGAGDGAAGGDAIINGLVESVARLTTELAEVRSELAEVRTELAEARARVEVLEGQQQQPAKARCSDQQQQ